MEQSRIGYPMVGCLVGWLLNYCGVVKWNYDRKQVLPCTLWVFGYADQINWRYSAYKLNGRNETMERRKKIWKKTTTQEQHNMINIRMRS